MTGVLDPTTAAAPRKSLAGDPKTGSGVPNNVRLLDSRRVEVAPLTANADAARPPVLEVAKDALCPAADRERIGVRFLNRIRAWMVVPVVDFALMVAPLAWRPPQFYAIVTMAVLATFLLTGGGRYARTSTPQRLGRAAHDPHPDADGGRGGCFGDPLHAPKGSGNNLPRDRLPGHGAGCCWPRHHHTSHCLRSPKGDCAVSHRPGRGRSAGR